MFVCRFFNWLRTFVSLPVCRRCPPRSSLFFIISIDDHSSRSNLGFPELTDFQLEVSSPIERQEASETFRVHKSINEQRKGELFDRRR